MSQCQFLAPYHVLLLHLRNVGHAEVLRVELHHLCTMQYLSTNVVHGNSNAKWVTLSHCGSLLSSTLFCFAMSAGACEVQTSVGFKWCPLDFFVSSCISWHLKSGDQPHLVSNPDVRPLSSWGITHRLYNILKRILVSTCLHKGSNPPTPLKNILNGDAHIHTNT